MQAPATIATSLQCHVGQLLVDYFLISTQHSILHVCLSGAHDNVQHASFSEEPHTLLIRAASSTLNQEGEELSRSSLPTIEWKMMGNLGQNDNNR
jgi:hypothetical protein